MTALSSSTASAFDAGDEPFCRAELRNLGLEEAQTVEVVSRPVPLFIERIARFRVSQTLSILGPHRSCLYLQKIWLSQRGEVRAIPAVYLDALLLIKEHGKS